MLLSEKARVIWQTAVDAVRPEVLLRQALDDQQLLEMLRAAPCIVVLGGGKAGAAMSAALEDALDLELLRKLEGVVNVPDELVRPLSRIRLHAARPAGTNHPTEAGVAGSREILQLASSAGKDDVALCLISGGGSALLPAPAEGVTLADKQEVTKLLHACGATINDMNTVRKHLSAIKGGRLAQAFTGKALVSLIISDVIGDPLDVIASGPTCADPTTFADALAVLDRFGLKGKVPATVIDFLEKGRGGAIAETLKEMPPIVTNLVLGNNARALAAAHAKAVELGFNVVNLGSYVDGETMHVAETLAALVPSIRRDGVPVAAPACVLSGGETTVTLAGNHGRGGRNQEFVLASLLKLGSEGMRDVVILSGGTDGEDGPTDAAGALADEHTLSKARDLGLEAADFLRRNDAYSFFQAAAGLLITGLTQTNVMDVRVTLVGR